MSDVKNKRIKWGVISLINFILFIMLLFHFPIMMNKMYSDLVPLCWYKFPVYACEYNDESGGNTALGGSIYITFQVGGMAEYFLLRDIK